MRFLPFLILVYALRCWALHESDVGVVDWYKKLIGVPLYQSGSTAPRFALVEGRNIILTATESNVLAAIEAKDGSISWRYVFDAEDRIMGFYQNGDIVVALSGPGGATVRILDMKSGQVTLERRLHPISNGQLVEPSILGKDITFDAESEDVYTLTNGYTVTRLNGTTGDPLWTWSSPDQASLTNFNKLLYTPESIYAVGASTSFASYTLHVVALSTIDGHVVTSTGIPSSITDPTTDIFAFTHDSPFVAWLEDGQVKSLRLTPTLNGKTKITKGEGNEMREQGACFGAGSIGADGDLSAFTIKTSFGESNPAAIYTCTESHVARTFWSVDSKKLVLEVASLPALLLPFPIEEHGPVAHFALHVSSQGEPHIVVTTESGAIQLYQGTELQWTREEALAMSVHMEFIELPERISAEADATKGESFIQRVLRHAVLAKDFPQYLTGFVRRFITGSYASATSSATALTDGGLSRDAFGFRQIIVTATVSGKIFGIDSSNGDIIWSRLFDLDGRSDEDTIIPLKMRTITTVSDGAYPEVVIVAERYSPSLETVVFHLDALTGEDLKIGGVTIFEGEATDVFFLDHQLKFFVLLDENMRVHLYPDTPQTQLAFGEVASTLSFPLHYATERHQAITGYGVLLKTGIDALPVAYPTWVLPLPPGEELKTLLPPASRGPVASLGKVLGDRTTLYKYLNPRLLTALTVSSSKNTCGLYVFDSTKGTIVYQTRVPANRGVCDVKTVLVENWLVYHYYESEVPDGNVQGTKGYRLVTVELYEGQGVDDKTQSSSMSSFVNASTNVLAFEESYIFPHAISALAPTITKFGISAKDLIVATKNHKIQSFPRRLLNPRRPHRKPTAEEAEEGLFQYDSLVHDDPKRVISHNYEVANVGGIVTSPALLESTSLVLAFGLDMFLTRVAPSGTFDVLSENFNKAQLVLTVSGLLVAIMITKPMVQRKRLREKWYI